MTSWKAWVYVPNGLIKREELSASALSEIAELLIKSSQCFERLYICDQSKLFQDITIG